MKKLFFLLALAGIMISCRQPVKEQASSAASDSTKSEIKIVDNGNVTFDKYFSDKTMRLDYNHSGSSKEEHFAVDGIVSDGAWPGSKFVLIDKLEMGPYFFSVIDKESKILLFSRGFASIFGEGQSTPEADKTWGSFNESVRFPWPLKPVTVIIGIRDPQTNKFKTTWTTDIDPASRVVNPADLVHTNVVDVIQDNGPAAEKVDIVILGDGYTKIEMGKFRKDAKKLSAFMMDQEPYISRKKDINIRAVETPSEVSGVCKPHPGVFKRSALGVQYGVFDSERYALTFDNKTVRNVASQVPYDFMIILVNERTYGGGGIYNLYATVSVDNKFANYMIVHEFGHHMGGLADEYYTSSVSYEAQDIKLEPWEPNVTALLDKNNLKWKDLVTAGTPVPTPWNKEPFDKFGYEVQKQRDSLRHAKVPEEVMEALFMRQYKQEDEYFSREKYKDAVGAFEGADYTQKGLFRSQLDCIMFTRHIHFCKVCQSSLIRVMEQYTAKGPGK
ncbi:MAG: M64 family metallo-endopeptidase [Bacteroidetes bacterium]|nr:M64 family metallo-endopeptidase [Bacteroidota bacterium]